MSEKQMKPRTTDADRKKRKKKQKRQSGGRKFLIFLGTVIVIVATVLVSAKIAWPDVDLLFFLPQPAHDYVHEDVLSNTTTTTTEPTVSETTTEPEPPKPEGHYAPIEDFAFDRDAKGNLVGNILQGGKTWHDDKYIYHIVDCDGIYRFATGSETYAKVYSTADYLSNLNIKGDYLYFTNETDKKLYYLNKNGKESAVAMADNIRTAYLYDDYLYTVSYSDILAKIKVADSSVTTLYSSPNNRIELVGISLKRVYFVSTDNTGGCRFMTVDNEGAEAPVLFRDNAPETEVKAPVLEDGFLYYYTQNEDGTYDLNRQKFGSENVVTLVQGTTEPDYAIVDMNSVFYAHREGETFYAKEYNMNSGDRVVRLKAEKVADDNSLMVQHGGSYDFIIGWRSEKSWIYYGSSMQTSSNLIMYFSDGQWQY